MSSKLTILWVMPDIKIYKNFNSLVQKIFGEKTDITIVNSGLEAITTARKKQYDFIIIQNSLSDISVQFTIATIRYFEFFEDKYTSMVLLCHRHKPFGPLENEYLLQQTEAILFGSIRSKSVQQCLQNLIGKSINPMKK